MKPMKLKNKSATIIFDIPEATDPISIATYICVAIESWGGSMTPDNPLFNGLRVRSITFDGTKFINEGIPNDEAAV